MRASLKLSLLFSSIAILGACSAPADSESDRAASEAASSIAAPRPIAPASASRSRATKPHFRWQLAQGATGARVQICRDRACQLVEQTIEATGTSASPTTDLAPGVHFWRAYGKNGTSTGARPSSTWEFAVAASGAIADYDGDGKADTAIGSAGSNAAISIFGGSAFGIPAYATSSLAAPSSSKGYFGSGVANAGDVNGDGFADLIVSSPADSDADARVFVYLGSASGLGKSPAVTLKSPTPNPGAFGFAIAGAGDIDGDGYGDIVVKHASVQEPGNGPPASRSFDHAYVYRGNSRGTETIPSFDLKDPNGPLLDMTPAGDVNGDGYADVLVHEQLTMNGIVRVHLGGPSGLSTTPAVVLHAPDVRYAPSFGWIAICAGDVNGDGFDDIAIAAQKSVSAPDDAPPWQVVVFAGKTGGVAAAPIATIAPPSDVTAGDARLAAAGDVNGDGFADLLVGIEGASAFAETAPALVYFGATGGIAADPGERIPNGARTTLTGFSFGRLVAGVGDANGDGYDDVIVGPYDRMVYSPTSLIGVAFLDRTLFAYDGTAFGLALSPDTAIYTTDPTFGVVAVAR